MFGAKPSEIERSLWREQLVVRLASWFGAFALLPSASGLYERSDVLDSWDSDITGAAP